MSRLIRRFTGLVSGLALSAGVLAHPGHPLPPGQPAQGHSHLLGGLAGDPWSVLALALLAAFAACVVVARRRRSARSGPLRRRD